MLLGGGGWTSLFMEFMENYNSFYPSSIFSTPSIQNANFMMSMKKAYTGARDLGTSFKSELLKGTNEETIER